MSYHMPIELCTLERRGQRETAKLTDLELDVTSRKPVRELVDPAERGLTALSAHAREGHLLSGAGRRRTRIGLLLTSARLLAHGRRRLSCVGRVRVLVVVLRLRLLGR